jgi:hypothetical protein
MVSTPSQSQLLFTTAPTTTDFSGLDQAAASTILQIKQQQTQDGIMKTMPSYIVNNFAQLVGVFLIIIHTLWKYGNKVSKLYQSNHKLSSWEIIDQ